MTKTYHANFPLNLCDESLLFHARIHPLLDENYPNTWVKREDESGFGISGSKKRKYASIIPYLKKNNFDCVGIIGGSNSNNIIGLIQLLTENHFPFKVFLKTNNATQNNGNAFLLSLLMDRDKIIWINPSEWENVEKIACNSLSTEFLNYKIIPEGASCKEALPGAISLAADIIQNEKNSGLNFNHIFIDAGTCLMAIALILEFSRLKKNTIIHVVQMADDETYFHKQLFKIMEWGRDFDLNYSIPSNYLIYKPFTAKSFGSVNKTILTKTKEYAQKYGILTDPIYSTKLFISALDIIKTHKLKGNKLIIHSGGGMGLFGFQDKLLF